MAVTRSPRFKLHRWDSGSDPYNRAQNDLDNLQVETLGAVFREGADADKGTASDAALVKSFYNATDTGVLYYSNGTNWIPLNDYGEAGDISSVTIATSASAGSSSEIARADHVHALGTPSTPASVSTTAATGSSSTPARADHVHDIENGAIAAIKLADNAVTSDKINALAVTEGKIASGAVTAGKIGSNAVTNAKIQDGAVTPLKIDSTLAGNGLERNGTTGIITVKAGSNITVDASGVNFAGGITTSQISDSQVTEAKIADGAVTAGKIGTGAVTPLKIGSTLAGNGISRDGVTGILSVNPASGGGLTVSASGISISTSGGVIESMIASGAVTEAKIGSGAVTEGKIGTAAVTPLKIASSLAGNGISRDGGTGVLSVNPASGGGLSVSGSGVSIASSGVLEAMIASNAVVEAKIANGAVTPLKVASTIVGTGGSAGGLQRNGTTGILSVLTDSATLTVNGSGQIAVGTITNSNISDSTISPLKLTTATAGSGIARNGTTGALSVDVDASTVVISGGKVAVGTVVEANIGSGAVTEAKIGSAAVTGAKAGAGVYRNVNSLTTGGKIEFMAAASLPSVGSTLGAGYTNGDILFGY